MSKPYHVCGLGNAIVDMQVQVEESVIDQLSLRKAGMKLVDLAEQNAAIEALGGTKPIQASGGSAANTIIALAQLGANAAYNCVLGDDLNGQFYLEEMSALGVSLQAGFRKSGVTGTCLVLITPDAERTMVTHLGATAEFGALDVSEEHLRQSEWVYIEGYLLSSEEGRQAVRRSLELAKKYDTKIALTFSDAFIVESFGDALAEVVDASELIFANLDEARSFTKLEDEKAVFENLKTRVPQVALTLGERGALLHLAGTDCVLEANPVKAIDDTGAGDMFAGGLLYGICSGLEPEQSGKLACFLASQVVSQLGPRLHSNVRELAKALL